jgi:histone deacetylase 8
VKHILELAVPTLLLGGGGYHPPSAAKHFALLTSCVLGKTLDEQIPVDAEYWEELERDGTIHIGRDAGLTADGEEQVSALCTALEAKLK